MIGREIEARVALWRLNVPWVENAAPTIGVPSFRHLSISEVKGVGEILVGIHPFDMIHFVDLNPEGGHVLLSLQSYRGCKHENQKSDSCLHRYVVYFETLLTS